MGIPKFQVTIPVFLWFLALGFMSWVTNLNNLFYLGLFIAAGWFVFIPLFLEVGFANKSILWFKRAGIIGIIIAAWGLFTTGLDLNWFVYVKQGLFLLSALLAFVGALIALLKTK
jgi:hypothetical protein